MDKIYIGIICFNQREFEDFKFKLIGKKNYIEFICLNTVADLEGRVFDAVFYIDRGGSNPEYDRIRYFAKTRIR